MHSLKADEQILRNSIEEGKKQILSILEDNGGTMPEEELVKKEQEELSIKKEITSQECRTWFAENEKNRAVLLGVKKHQTVMQGTEKKYVWVRELSNTANGQVTGKPKIELETYVQMAYFERILRRANVRLMTMSQGQYELKRREDAENKKEKAKEKKMLYLDCFNNHCLYYFYDRECKQSEEDFSEWMSSNESRKYY